MFYEYLKKQDELNPIKRAEVLKMENKFFFSHEMINTYTNEKIELDELILIALYTIDYVIKKKWNKKYNFYINSDFSIKILIEKSLGIRISDENFFDTIYFLDYVKFIYRFTCAKKFRMTNDSVKQLRINSWGREYIAERALMSKHKLNFGKLKQYCENYFCENEELYKDVMQCLMENMTVENSSKIESINQKLEIKLLS